MSSEAKKIIPLNSDRPIFDLIKDCSLSEKNELKLMKHIQSKKFLLVLLSKSAADRLARFKVPAFKIGSGEVIILSL